MSIDYYRENRGLTLIIKVWSQLSFINLILLNAVSDTTHKLLVYDAHMSHIRSLMTLQIQFASLIQLHLS